MSTETQKESYKAQVGVGLHSFRVISFKYHPVPAGEKAVADNVKFLTKSRLATDGLLTTIGVNLVIEIVFINKEEEPPFAELDTETMFTLTGASEGLKGESLKVGTPVTFPKDFLHQIVETSLGICRGVLFTQTANTPFDQILLPYVNIESLLPKFVPVVEFGSFQKDLEAQPHTEEKT